MPSLATQVVGTRRGTCASCIDGAIINTTSRSGIGRLRLEPDDGQSSRPVLRGLGCGNGARLPDYVFGRYQSSKEVEPSGEIRSRSRLMPQDAWRIVIPDHHEGYISAEQFVINRERLAANRTNREGLAGPVREGLCLLQGLLLCGVCGRRLGVRYTGNGSLYPIYQCVWKHRESLASRACLSVPSAPLDQAIADRL